MKTIKSQADIEDLKNLGYPQKVIDHINQYFQKVQDAYGEDYCPQDHGWIILLTEGDPLTYEGVDLISIIKEFVDLDYPSNIFDVLTVNNDFGMTFMLPNESWVGKELLEQLKTFQNYEGNISEL